MKHLLRFVCLAPACLLAANLCAGNVPAAGAAARPALRPAAAAPARTPSIAAEEAKAQLDAAARAHLERVVRTLRPNQANKDVTRQESNFVATYLVVDADRMTTELIADQTHGNAYVGNVVYVVHEYRCVGATREAALNGSFRKAKSRRIREFTRYADGKWHL